MHARRNPNLDAQILEGERRKRIDECTGLLLLLDCGLKKIGLKLALTIG